MKRFTASWRRALGLGVVGVGLLTASAAAAATTLTVWCWDPNFNGVAMREAGAHLRQDASRRDAQRHRHDQPG